MKKFLLFIGLVLACSIVFSQIALIYICSNQLHWLQCTSTITSILAFIVAVLYFFRPKLKIEIETTNEAIRIKCTNKNCFPTTIKDIKCDVVLSKDTTFDVTDTHKLRKDYITGIKHEDNYIFISDIKREDFSKYKCLKVRILAMNILGVRKYYEKTLEIQNNHQ